MSKNIVTIVERYLDKYHSCLHYLIFLLTITLLSACVTYDHAIPLTHQKSDKKPAHKISQPRTSKKPIVNKKQSAKKILQVNQSRQSAGATTKEKLAKGEAAVTTNLCDPAIQEKSRNALLRNLLTPLR